MAIAVNWNSVLSAEFGRIISKAMAKKPEDRYEDARKMADDLRQAREAIDEDEQSEIYITERSLLGKIVVGGLVIGALAAAGAGIAYALGYLPWPGAP